MLGWLTSVMSVITAGKQDQKLRSEQWKDKQNADLFCLNLTIQTNVIYILTS